VTKIVHQLTNTNRQNKLLYDKTDACPSCGIQEETFQHALKCTAASTQSACQEALLRLEKLLATNGTPTLVTSVIMGGFWDWLDPAFHETSRSRPTTFGSLRPVDILITQAYSEQFHSIGWYQFCLGHISHRWHQAVQALLPCPQTYNKLQWRSNLVHALWQFTKSLWHHRNTVIHGTSAEASAQLILTGLRDQVRHHYSMFLADNGYVLARHQYLFTSRTLDQRLSLSYDHLNCWLRSIQEACELYATHLASQQTAARRFFGPPRVAPSPPPSDYTDEDYSGSNQQDTASTSLTTSATHLTARIHSVDTGTLSETVDWASAVEDTITYTTSHSSDNSNIFDFVGFNSQLSVPGSPPTVIHGHSLRSSETTDDDNSLLIISC